MPLNLIPGTIALLIALHWFSKICAERNARHFRTVLYLYFQTACTFFIVISWAYSRGSIDGTGKPTDEIGIWISWAMNLCSRLNDEFGIVAEILIFVFLPQILVYAVAGLYGHAQRTFLFTFLMHPIFYFLGKAIVSFCALAIIALPFAHIYKLTDDKNIAHLPSLLIYVTASTSFLALPMGFLAFILYRNDLRNLCPKTFQNMILRLHERMTRGEP